MRQHGTLGRRGRPRRVQYLRHVLIVYLDLGLGGTFPASRHAHNVEFISIVERAADLAPPELRSLDALHLATALELGGELGRFFCYDSRLARAAAALSVDVQHPGAA